MRAGQAPRHRQRARGNLTAHDRGGRFIPWEIPGEWGEDLRRAFRGRR